MKLVALAAVMCVSAEIPGRASAQEVPAAMQRRTFLSAQGSRDYFVSRPASLPAKGDDRSLVVMLHGCGQTADDFARGTRMNAAAAAGGFIVLYPEQSLAASPQRCWNWFLPGQSTREHGEVAILAAMIDSVAFAEGVAAEHVSIVGMSAGGALAADLAVAYPERYAAIAVHSGLPALAAHDVMSALAAMRNGLGDGDALGAAAYAAMGPRPRAMPVIALQGSDDKVVSTKNLALIARQWTVVNSHFPGVKTAVVSQMFDGVGHAWSGGAPEGSFTAPTGPDATTIVVAFLRRVGAITGRR